MSILAQEAADAYTAMQTAQVASARDAVVSSLVRPDGTRLTLSDAGLKRASADLVSGLVVWSDGTIHLAAQRREGRWRAVLVTQEAGEWRMVAEVGSLADIGAALAAS